MDGDKELVTRLLRDSAAIFLVNPDDIIKRGGSYTLRIPRACAYWYLITIAHWPLHRIASANPFKYTFTNIALSSRDFIDKCGYSERTERFRMKAIETFDQTWSEISDERLEKERVSRKRPRKI